MNAAEQIDLEWKCDVCAEPLHWVDFKKEWQCGNVYCGQEPRNPKCRYCGEDTTFYYSAATYFCHTYYCKGADIDRQFGR